MDLQINALNMTMTDELRERIQARVEKLSKIDANVTDARFEIRHQRARKPEERFIAQFTIRTPRQVLRVEDMGNEPEFAIDAAVDRMSRRIRRFHDRRTERQKRATPNLGELAAQQAEQDLAATLAADVAAEQGSDEMEIVRRKQFEILPMSAVEAAEQLELVGHDFFLFFNPDTSMVNVVYRRRDGNYGLIEPEVG